MAEPVPRRPARPGGKGRGPAARGGARGPRSGAAGRIAAPTAAPARSAGEEDGATPSGLGAPVLRLAGYEGPLDALLDQARAGRVDLARLPLPALVEQCVAALDAALRARREAAAAGTQRGGDEGEGVGDAAPTLRCLAEWLVMAAWLAWLRSRLLLPEHDPEARAARAEAEAFRRGLARRAAVQEATDWLEGRPQLGRDVFASGATLRGVQQDAERAAAERAALLRAYARRIDPELPGQGREAAAYSPHPLRLWRVPDALQRIERLLDAAPDPEADGGTNLWRFLPKAGGLAAAGLACKAVPDPALLDRSAAASTLAATLELARQGRVTLAQRDGFGRIEAHPARGETAAESTRDR